MTSGSAAMTRRGPDGTLLAILAFALAVRVAALLAFPSLHHPDEAFQLYEQGHRLVFGYGIKPWEFEDGLRSPVVPHALAALFALAEPVLDGPAGYIRFAQTILALLSLIPIAAIYAMGRRISPTHAILAGLVAATWFELVYFSFRPLTEALAADAVLTALALGSRPFSEISKGRLVAVGVCLAFAAMLRIHLAPGLLFVALWLGRGEVRARWVPLLLGAAPVLLVFGLADWAAWGAPFRSVVNAVWVNAGENKASHYGVDPLGWYLVSLLKTWNLAFPALAILIALRLRTSMMWIGFAVLVIASHSLIPHKEYRFTFPAVASLVIVAALGCADLVERWRAKPDPTSAGAPTAAVATAWIAASALLAVLPTFSGNWTLSRDAIRASYWLSHQPSLCGLALYDAHWFDTGGYAFLHRQVPIYPLRLEPDRASRSTDAFNFVLGRRSDLPSLGPGYRVAWCASGATCVLSRPGACAAVPGLIPLSQRSRLGEAPID